MRRNALVLSIAMVAGLLSVSAPASAERLGKQGCTPGYWKNHEGRWEEYEPSDPLRRITGMDFPERFADFESKTFRQALRFEGGTGRRGALRIMLRSATAAFLNAAHEGVGYPYRRFSDPGHLRRMIRNALASEDRATMLDVAATLDAANNLGCPLRR